MTKLDKSTVVEIQFRIGAKLFNELTARRSTQYVKGYKKAADVICRVMGDAKDEADQALGSIIPVAVIDGSMGGAQIFEIACDMCGVLARGTQEEIFSGNSALELISKLLHSCGGDIRVIPTGEYK